MSDLQAIAITAPLSDDCILAMLDYNNPNYGMRLELIVQRLYEAVLKPGDCAIDGGCNTGHHTFPMARIVGESGSVLSVEAQREPLEQLQTQIAELGFKNIETLHGALVKTAGLMEFTGIVGETGWGGLKETPWTPKHLERRVFQVEGYTLDRLAERMERLRFVKLDLEGGDFDALQGARSILAKQDCGIAFENAGPLGQKLYQYSYDDFAGFFESLQYSVYDVFGRKLTAEMTSSIPYKCPPEAFAAPAGSEIETAMVNAAIAACHEALAKG